jgi:hypothetical protein
MNIGEGIRYYLAAVACVFLLGFAVTAVSIIIRGKHKSPTLGDRLGMIAASLVLMAMVGHDLQQRLQTAQIVADAAAADRDPPSEATLQHEDIEGPEVIAAYYRQGYAWAEAHGVEKAAECKSDNRAYSDGCREFLARRR